MDKKRYDEVLVACALVKDLMTFAAGDLSEIGEKVNINCIFSFFTELFIYY